MFFDGLERLLRIPCFRQCSGDLSICLYSVVTLKFVGNASGFFKVADSGVSRRDLSEY